LVLATACAAVACVAASPAPLALQKGALQPRPEVKSSAVIAHFTARAALEGDAGNPQKIDILVERWSTDKERDELAAAFAKSGPEGLLPALQNMRRRSAVLMHPGVQAQGARVRLRHPANLLFGQDVKTPAGRRIVFAAQQFIALGQPTSKWSDDIDFSLLDIRIGADGKGEGKVAHAKDVTYNKETKTFEIQNYAAQPVRLSEVTADKATKP
jgi:hypothetical protein